MSKEGSSDFKSKRSRILYQITAILIILVVVVGLIAFFLVDHSFNSLIEKSTDKMVQAEAETISASYEYTAEILLTDIFNKFQEYSPEEILQQFLNAIEQEGISEVQRYGVDMLISVVESGMLGLETTLVVLPPIPPVMTEPTVIASNDESLIYMEVPGYLKEAIEEGGTYIWMEDGIPELGLEGEYLITTYKLETGVVPPTFWAFGITPMHYKVTEIVDFYDREKGDISLSLALIVGGAVIFVILITFLILSYLIRKRITEPIDELSASAEQIMDGNLDIEIPIRKGEEFEGLKRAFKEMVDSIREMIIKSTSEE